MTLPPLLPEEIYMGMAYTSKRARLFKEMEKDARACIEAARQTGEVTSSCPPHRNWGRETAERNEWFEACFGMGERELITAHNAAVNRYRATHTRPWKCVRGLRRKSERAEALRNYVRLHSVLTVASGLTTSWR